MLCSDMTCYYLSEKKMMGLMQSSIHSLIDGLTVHNNMKRGRTEVKKAQYPPENPFQASVMRASAQASNQNYMWFDHTSSL